jgi:hypothetical protein
MTEPARPLGLIDSDISDDAPSLNALDSLRADFLGETDDDIVALPVRGRDGYEVRYSTRIQYEQLAAWRKRSEDKSMPGGINELLLGCVVLANCCRGIIRHGEEIVSAGEPLTFTSPALHNLLGVDRAVDAVRKFYGRDPRVTKTATAVLAAAGYDNDEVSADPTPL